MGSASESGGLRGRTGVWHKGIWEREVGRERRETPHPRLIRSLTHVRGTPKIELGNTRRCARASPDLVRSVIRPGHGV